MFSGRCVHIFRKWRENGLKCEAISVVFFARLREIFSSTHPYQTGISNFIFTGQTAHPASQGAIQHKFTSLIFSKRKREHREEKENNNRQGPPNKIPRHHRRRHSHVQNSFVVTSTVPHLLNGKSNEKMKRNWKSKPLTFVDTDLGCNHTCPSTQ